VRLVVTTLVVLAALLIPANALAESGTISGVSADPAGGLDVSTMVSIAQIRHSPASTRS